MITFSPDSPQAPSQPEKGPVPVPFSARDMRLKKILDNAHEPLSTPEWREFRREVNARVRHLQQKYGDAEAHKHAIFHVLTASSFFQEDGVDIEEDFPGEDSVELFVGNLAQKYGLKSGFDNVS